MGQRNPPDRVHATRKPWQMHRLCYASRSMIPVRKIQAIAVALALAGTMSVPAAAVVYVSDADGDVPRFASHRVDGSYRIFIHDDSPARALNLPGAKASPDLQARKSALDPHIERVAARHAVDPALVRAVIEIESRFHAGAVSPKGAVGAMQLMPETARRYSVADRRNAAQNIEGGVAYLKDLLARFNGNVALALAAYNAGENAVDRHGRVIPRFRETMLYVPQVLEAYLRYRSPEAASRSY